MKRTIAIASTTALLVVGTAFVVRAQTSSGMPACADLVPADSTGVYIPPEENVAGVQTAPGKLIWQMGLAAASCPDVQYGLTVFLDGPDGEAAPILASASTAGDILSDTLTFQLEINTHNADDGVCVVQTTMGSVANGTKTGAAFDGSGSRLLDRDPDGPIPGDGDGEEYCVALEHGQSPSRGVN